MPCLVALYGTMLLKPVLQENKKLCHRVFLCKGWGQSAKLGTHSAICSKLGTALQAYALNPCTKFAANPTSRKVKVNFSALLEQ